jgi:cation:H+ antiporter
VYLTLILFFVGFYILIQGANFLIKGASALTRILGVSNIVIGLLIAGIGTSIPEFSITIFANFIGESGIGIGTIVGSNTFNILFILGLCALLFPIQLKKEWVHRDLVWNIFAVLIALVFGLDGELSRPEGLILSALFLLWIFIVSKHKKVVDHEKTEDVSQLTIPIALGMILGGLIGVLIGGTWVVDGAIEIARALSVSERLIGLTIVGIGTSLPELAVSLVAAYRREHGIAVGNIIGSNIFDFLGILGPGSLIQPIVFPSGLILDTVITLSASMLLLLSVFVGKKYVLNRPKSFVFIILFFFYMTYVFMRG